MESRWKTITKFPKISEVDFAPWVGGVQPGSPPVGASVCCLRFLKSSAGLWDEGYDVGVINRDNGKENGSYYSMLG